MQGLLCTHTRNGVTVLKKYEKTKFNKKGDDTDLSSKNNSYKNMMYEQQLKHLPAGSIDKLVDIIENKIKPKKYALILHDKDTDEKGNLIEAHVHVMMSFQNARSLNKVASLLNDKPQYIEAWKGNSNNGYAYLVHRTNTATTKYQYDPARVIANFDYIELLENILSEVSSKNSMKIKNLLDLLYSGLITKEEVEKQITGAQYGRYKTQIENVYSKLLKKQSKDFKKEMIAQGKRVTVIWIYGEAGTGKTTFAKYYAEKRNQPYYLTGSSKDYFQKYLGEHTLIIDELRPRIIEFSDLLRILDPFEINKMLPSRYSDKELTCDLIIITTPYSPDAFYNCYFGNYTSITDSFKQLSRRLSLVIKMDYDHIHVMEYDSKNFKYNAVPNEDKDNIFSDANRPNISTIDNVDLFNSMFN